MAASRKRRVLLAVLAVVTLLVLSLVWLSRPRQLAALILDRAGNALGLQITASGVAEYRLRGTPQLVLREVSAREPGAASAVLEADRILLALPWSTIRGKGTDLTVQRVELDSPRLDLAALQHWQATRPPSDTRRLPVLIDGIGVDDGRIIGDGWEIRDIALSADTFHPSRPLAAALGGRYLDAPLETDFDLDITLGEAQALLERRATPATAGGRIEIRSGATTVPATVTLSGPLRHIDATLAVEPLRLGASARYRNGDTDLPLRLGVQGPLHYAGQTLALDADGLSLRGEDDDSPVPRLQAHGRMTVGGRQHDPALQLALDGRIAGWPTAWPTLPPPIGQSDSSLPFSLRYAGATDIGDPLQLRLARDATRFDARLRLPAMLDWLDTVDSGTPLPPLQGRLSAPRVEISGATLHGVEIEFEESIEK
ncbi:hypothetical protein [Marilutibacter chinensis]|uniref:AsmA domain-containing protein n=1 Tax=Marilutibacter chinensis TaxID=2912247 RepID=A0ABS9HWP0_9GAMM|nr:hypothetical protein [Lysobacter chinensis]MCF7222750.1 hypothetical protein [Lysobacter chinensis]